MFWINGDFHFRIFPSLAVVKSPSDVIFQLVTPRVRFTINENCKRDDKRCHLYVYEENKLCGAAQFQKNIIDIEG